MPKIVYDDIIDLKKIEEVYLNIKRSTKHREKIVKYEMFLTSNFAKIYEVLMNKNFKHSHYNIFLIQEPKWRIIMSENLTDKIINHLVSKYVLSPLIEPKLIASNVATRKDKGTKMAMFYMKKYINNLKINYNKVYVLKMDIRKYFYSIDHKILLAKIRKIVDDDDLYHLIYEIIDSVNKPYINEIIDSEIKKRDYLSFQSIEELKKLPRYQTGKGLPIGNMTSQILAIFYLNEVDHYIKEKLKIKHYIRYMDDFVLLHHDKNYLNYCLKEITRLLDGLKLELNNKTQIYELHNGLEFLGYKYRLKGKKLYVLVGNKTKKSIKNV